MQKQTDADIMLTLKSFHAVERRYEGRNSNTDTLKVEHSYLLPGYALLRILDGTYGASFFSAEDFKNYFEAISVRDAVSNCFGTVFNSFYAINGPACMLHINPDSTSASNVLSSLQSADCVCSIHCNEWPSVADEWFQRNRMHNWPSTEQIVDIIDMGCDFVPVRIPGSRTESLEWRVSFVRAERSLIRSMNSAQLKTLCLLKVLFKSKVLGDFFHQRISFYIAKTTLLWISEEHNAYEWSDNLCLKYLWLCLRRIMSCIIEGHCSNYFMRDSNLLYGKLKEHEKEILNHPLYNFTRREHFRDNVKNLPIFTGMKGTLFGILPFMKTVLENDLMKSLMANFLNRCTEEWIGNIIFSSCSTPQDENWRNSVDEMQNYMLVIKRNRRSITESSISDFLIRLLSCAQIRLMNVAICRHDLSHNEIVCIINKLLVAANLRAEKLCVSEITQIAHVYFTNELYENTLHIIIPMLEAFRNTPCIRIENKHSMFRIVSSFKLDMNNVSYSSTRRPISNITFFNLEESILTHHLRVEIISSIVEKGEYIGYALLSQFHVTMSPLVYAYYMKYKCYRNLGNNIYSCQVLKELKRQILQEQNHRYHGLNLLGCSFYESGYFEDALKAFAMAFKERNSRRSTLYHTAVLLRKCFDDH